MYRTSFGNHHGKQHQPGWDTTSNDYHAHLLRMERTPSVLTDVPHRYPNGHNMMFNNKVRYDQDYDRVGHQANHNHLHATPPAEKVHMVEYKLTTECDKNGNCEEVFEESVDVEADGFIQQKHKGFELCKWKTFKV